MEYIIILIAFAVTTAIMIFIYFKTKNKKHQTKPRSNNWRGAEEEYIFTGNTDNSTYDSQRMRIIFYQILETMYIIESSSSVDTVMSRLNFFESKWEELTLAFGDKRYKTDFQISLDKYKSMYYDRTIDEQDATAILSPHDVSIDSYRFSALFNCFSRYYSLQMEQISALKQQNAINKRKQKLLSVLDDVQNSIQPCNEYQEKAYSKLTEIRNFIENSMSPEGK